MNGDFSIPTPGRYVYEVKVVRWPWLGRVDWIPFGKVFGPVGCFLYLGWLQGGSAVCQNPICPEYQVMFWGLTSSLTCFSPPFFQRNRSNRLESMSYFQEDTQPTAEIETLNPSEGLQRSARTPMCGGPVRCLKTWLSELLVSPFMYQIHRS